MSEAAEQVQETPNYAELAKQHFGTGYHGEAPAEAPAEVVAESPSEEPEETLLEDAEDLPEAEAPQISSLRELIEAQEWDPEWAQSLRVGVKIDGEAGEASIDDLVRSYQTQEAATRRLEEAKARAAEIRQEATQQQEAVRAQMAVLGTLFQQVEGQVAAEFQGVNWEKLEADDPGEYARLKIRKAEREGQLGQMKAQALSQYQQALGQQQQQEQAKQQERLQAEQQALHAALPHWSDPQVAKAEQEALVSHLTSLGFSQEDVLGASDHRLILLALDAMKYRESQAKADVTAKKVAKVPKVLKPGAPKSPQQASQAQEASLRARIRNGGRSEDAIRAAAELQKLRRQ